MSAAPPTDWNPASPEVLNDQIAAYDAMRRRCAIAHSDYLWWSLFRHADLMRVLHDPASFSNAASNHLSIPNAMDPPEHTPYRQIIERYFSVERMADFEPTCRAIVDALIAALPRGEPFEAMAGFAQPWAIFAASAQQGDTRVASLPRP